jgi:hypothetical protein
MSTPIDSGMDTDALCPAVRTLCDTLSRKFNEGPPGFGSVTFWAMHEEDVRVATHPVQRATDHLRI